MKIFIFIFISIVISGCAPVMLRNGDTGEIAKCWQEGPFPIIHQLQCVNSYEQQGWVKTDHKKERQLQASLEEEKGLCWKRIQNNPSLKVIANKLSLGGARNQTFSMLTNTRKPTTAEKAAISTYADLAMNCIRGYSKGYAHPAHRLANNDAISAHEDLLVTLYKGQITYGEFAKSVKEISLLVSSAFVEIDKVLKADAANANARAQQVAIQRQHAYAAIKSAEANRANAAANQKAATSLMFKNPVRNSSTGITCRSTRFGNSVTTNCD